MRISLLIMRLRCECRTKRERPRSEAVFGSGPGDYHDPPANPAAEVDPFASGGGKRALLGGISQIRFLRFYLFIFPARARPLPPPPRIDFGGESGNTRKIPIFPRNKRGKLSAFPVTLGGGGHRSEFRSRPNISFIFFNRSDCSLRVSRPHVTGNHAFKPGARKNPIYSNCLWTFSLLRIREGGRRRAFLRDLLASNNFGRKF